MSLAISTDRQLASVQRRTVGILVVAQIVAGLGIGATVAMGSIVAADIAGAAWAGAAVTSSTLGAAAVAIPLARLALARGRRIALAMGIFAAAGGSILVITATNLRVLPLLLIGYLLLGVGSAVNLQARFAAIDLAPPKHRGRDLSIVVWSTTIGAVAGPNLLAPGEHLGRFLGIDPHSGPFVIALAAQAVTVTLILIALRPDPLLVARAREASLESAQPGGSPEGVTNATTQFEAPARHPDPPSTHRSGALVMAIATMALAHAVMVGVMSMTPVHLLGHGAELEVVGLVVSLHVAGMYGLSPIFGWWSDRAGRLRVILVGALIYAGALAAVIAGPENEFMVTVGLILLGLGWSAVTVSAAALITDLSDGPLRVRVQGRSDMAMNLSGATAGALAGPVLALVGYAGLAAATGVLVAVIVLMAELIRRSRTAWM